VLLKLEMSLRWEEGMKSEVIYPTKGLLKKDFLRKDGRKPIRFEVFVWSVIQNKTQP
jgi:hypothetical protein